MTTRQKSPAIDLPRPGTYRLVAAQSEIRFWVRHRFGTGTVRGRFSPTGAIVIVRDPVHLSTVSASADAASFESGNAGRDEKVRSATFLDTARYPTMTFESHAVEQHDDGGWEIRGQLIAHGVTSAAAFTVTEVRTEGTFVDLVAVGSVDRYAFGVKAMKGMAGRELHLTIHLRVERDGT